MIPNLRACIANVAARLNGGDVNGAVYDHTQGKHIPVSGSVGDAAVNVFDHERRAHVTGSAPNLYDHGTRRHVSLVMNGATFTGFDHFSGLNYSGRINGCAVTIFDYESGRHHQFTV